MNDEQTDKKDQTDPDEKPVEKNTAPHSRGRTFGRRGVEKRG